MTIASQEELRGLTRAGKVVAQTLKAVQALVKPGVTTAQLDEEAARIFAEAGARSAPKLVYDFPGTILISVNDEVVHGIPGSQVLAEGDLVKIDVTVELDGYMADAAVTVAMPPVSPLNRLLADTARSALYRAIDGARAGEPIAHIGRAVQSEVQRRGLTIIPELHGHGIGRVIHEEPSIPNYYNSRDQRRLKAGMVITIEPIITSGSGKIFEDEDGWTIKTTDGSPAAHHEHTLVITEDKPLLLTAA